MEAMEVGSSIEARSENCGPKPEEIGPDFHQLGGLMAVPPETGSSFTALLELPANQAVELLVHSPDSVDTPPPSHSPASMAKLSGEAFNQQCLPGPLPLSICPFDAALINRAARFSVFASSGNSESSRSKPPRLVKQEPGDADSNPNSSPAVSYPTVQKPSNKRKDREKKAKESNKKNKKALANEISTAEENGGEKLPYVHVRARRGQATDSHSLAERARREKINARMKLLQELVPGCNKISGTASVLDEIINHVQSLQRQVEFLSMRLAAVNPIIDFNLDNFMAAENVSPLESYFSGLIMPSVGPEGEIRPQSQQLWHSDGFHQPILNREETPSNFVAPEISCLRYDSSADSAFLDSSKLKMEL